MVMMLPTGDGPMDPISEDLARKYFKDLIIGLSPSSNPCIISTSLRASSLHDPPGIILASSSRSCQPPLAAPCSSAADTPRVSLSLPTSSFLGVCNSRARISGGASASASIPTTLYATNHGTVR
jgi:hypothetical protein